MLVPRTRQQPRKCNRLVPPALQQPRHHHLSHHLRPVPPAGHNVSETELRGNSFYILLRDYPEMVHVRRYNDLWEEVIEVMPGRDVHTMAQQGWNIIDADASLQSRTTFSVPTDVHWYPQSVEAQIMTQSRERVAVAGGAGFIGSWMAKSLKADGYFVVVADWKENEFMEADEFCDEFMLCDLRQMSNCIKLTEGCCDVYNFAADMGGMGFIQSNESVLMFNNTLISFSMLEAARRNKVQRYFYASSACVYNEDKQLDANNPGLKESDAWPAKPQDTYGLEKLCSEELGFAYMRDFGFYFRTARFHNVYGPRGTWKGGREKAPAAFCRKAICSEKDFEMWGDGGQTRSFVYIEDCIEGVRRIMDAKDLDVCVNLGSTEMVTMNDFAKLALKMAGKPDLPIRHVQGPLGVRGRNSNNDLILQKLNWEPATSIADGMRKTFDWIKGQIEGEMATGQLEDISQYCVSKVVQQTTESLDKLAPK